MTDRTRERSTGAMVGWRYIDFEALASDYETQFMTPATLIEDPAAATDWRHRPRPTVANPDPAWLPGPAPDL